jgi:hypothetical protein
MTKKPNQTTMQATPKAFATAHRWPAYCVALFYENTSMQFKLVDSFAPVQSPLPSRLIRLPRGFPAHGVLASGG